MKKFNKYGANHLNNENSNTQLRKDLGISHITPSMEKQMIDKLHNTSKEDLCEMILRTIQSDGFMDLMEYKRKELVSEYGDDKSVQRLHKPIMNSELMLVVTTLVFEYMKDKVDNSINKIIVPKFMENPNVLPHFVLIQISNIREEGLDMNTLENMIDWNS